MRIQPKHCLLPVRMNSHWNICYTCIYLKCDGISVIKELQATVSMQVWLLNTDSKSHVIGEFRGWWRCPDLYDFVCVNPGEALISKISSCQMSIVSKEGLSACSNGTNTAQIWQLFICHARFMETIFYFGLKQWQSRRSEHVFGNKQMSRDPRWSHDLLELIYTTMAAF